MRLKTVEMRAVICIGSVLTLTLGLAATRAMAAPKKSHSHPAVPPGGANQIANKFTGKVGETVFTGKFRFTALSYETVPTYTLKYMSPASTLTADDGQTFVVVHCRIKNGTPIRQEIALSTSPYSGNDDTTLTDDQEQTYQPVNYHGEFQGYDVHPEDNAPIGVWMLPGAAANFAVIFSVPTATKVAAFIFGIEKYDRATKSKQTDIRITLQ